MKKLLASLVWLVAACAPLSATNYYFSDTDYTLFESNGSAFAAGNLKLGKFDSGFLPSGSNVDSWAAHWLSGSAGFYDPSSPEWSASLILTDNSTFAIGDQLFLWAYNSVTGSGREWALLTDPAWKIVANSTTNLFDQFFGFSSSTTAVFGQINVNAQQITAAAAVAGAAVPEPATWLSVVTGSVLIVMAGVRRRARRAT